MTYKTILVNVDASPQTPERTRIAAQLAATFDSHLIGLGSTGVPAPFVLQGTMGESLVDLQPLIVERRHIVEQALSSFDEIANRHGATSREKRLVSDEIGLALCLQAPYVDLIVVSLAGDETAAYERMDLPQYVVLHARRPVLILPPAGAISHIGKRILVAWDGSAAATRAVNDALPLLCNAATVKIIVLTSKGLFDELDEQPGIYLAQHLARHGVDVHVSSQPASHGSTGEALLDYAARSNSDVLVMGGYGHTRFRELLLGGATRSVLGAMTIPVLMSH